MPEFVARFPLDWPAGRRHLVRLIMSETPPSKHYERRYSTGELVRRLFGLAWQFRGDCLRSLALSVMLLLLGLLGLQLLGVVIDVIRHALDATQRAPVYPFGWRPPAGWSPVHTVTVMALAIVAQAVLRAVLTYHYNMTTARLTQGKIVPDLRDRVYDKLQRLSFRFFDVHGSSSIFNRVTGDVQNTRLFVDGVVLQGVNMMLTLAVYLVFMWRIHPSLTVACAPALEDRRPRVPALEQCSPPPAAPPTSPNASR